MNRFGLEPAEVAGLVGVVVISIIMMIWFVLEGLGPIPLLIGAAAMLVGGVLGLFTLRMMLRKGVLPRGPRKR